MTHALITIVAPLTSDKIIPVRAQLEKLGNPARSSVQGALDNHSGKSGVHFMSLHALPASSGKGGHLVMEYSADPGGADDEDALDWIVERIGAQLSEIFANAADWKAKTKLLAYLRAHKIRIGFGWFDTPGLAFAGTPGMSVGRIRAEAALAARAAKLLEQQPGGIRPLERIIAVRDGLKADADTDWSWSLEPPPEPLAPQEETPISGLIGVLAWSFIKTYFLPLLILIAFGTAAVSFPAPDFMAGLTAGAKFLGMAVFAALIIVVVLLFFVYRALRSAEESDWTDERAPERSVLAEIRARENQTTHAHNHMISLTVLKPELVRSFTIRLAFWIIAQLATRSFKPGHLGDIGTIHFARWVTIPGTRGFVFFSNYGGSWESYLEDFITKAHNGLTAVWSNTVGFPKATNLFQDGATDGERFKRFARRSMLHTPFWYSAYPKLTTANIRANAGIRRGLSAALTDEEAMDWLSLFGSTLRPAEKLETGQIQSLAFGGLGFMPFGECVVVELGGDGQAARQWLREIRKEIAFGDGRRLERSAVITLALGPGALTKLGLPDDSLETFPAAFLDGMTADGRDRILGDFGPNHRDHWWWAKSETPPDAALLIYGRDDDSVAALCERVQEISTTPHKVTRHIPLTKIPEKRADRLEPFGFVDGISQPIVRGTYRSLRNPDPIHLVEPGEIILGYPDNRDNVPPGPTLNAINDPENRLPIAADPEEFAHNIVNVPRDIGRNGSFLVIRQLEQNVEAFSTYCEQEAERLEERLDEPFHVTAEFIGAKLVGRWKDGSSIMRYPYRSETELKSKKHLPQPKPMSRPQTQPKEGAPTQAAPAASGDNDFLFGTEDPEGLRCPFGAHIRRANPRDSLSPGSADQIDISNRHRILRVGRGYIPQEGEQGGLLFMCLNADIERQFEFVQQTWLASPVFHGLVSEVDPIVCDGREGANCFTVPTRDGPMRLKPMQQFVTTRGGGYFFLPGKRLIEYLAG